MPNWASAANPYYMQQQQWNPRANRIISNHFHFK